MSPSATLTDASAEASIISAADRLFYQRGVASVSMIEIRDDAEVSLRRMYKLFPSKSDLVAAWLRDRHKTWLAGFSSSVERQLTAEATPVDAVFGALTEWMTETNFRGCGFINTHAETADLTDEHQEIIRKHKAEFAGYLDRLLAGSPSLDGRALAVIVDGAIVQASIFASTDPITAAHQVAALVS